MAACGLDFGTSNSAVGVMRAGAPTLAPVERDATLIPSAIFFDFEQHGRILFGRHAIETYIGQHEGRLMRALKTILGSPLIDEATAVGRRRIPLTEVVEIFIRELKGRAETFLGEEIAQVVHGRPVRFVDGDDAADAKAQSVLEAIAKRVGFKDVSFEFEPIAAAYHYEETVAREELVLVADIGGGTSDFSVIRVGPALKLKPDRRDDILSYKGARIGGTDFDTLLSLEAVMPLLGLGTQLRDKDLPMPKASYFELATWSMINFVYTYKTERQTRELLAQSLEPQRVSRLLKTIRKHLGHRIAFAVEDAKIALSEDERHRMMLDFLEGGLFADATRGGFEKAIHEKTRRLTDVAGKCVTDAGIKPDAIQTIFYTGGSSLVPAVRKAIAAAAPHARPATGSDFLSVALGLTREAGRRFS
ncbi:MAG: Hsp70 family protein [Proteobacteria bacterium]|nr:Hsp70 family protein [Pseudomonadota bacterium]